MSDSAIEGIPTYRLTSIRKFVESITYRCLADGMLLQDLQLATERVEKWSEWPGFWLGRATAHEELGAQATWLGYAQTAGLHLARASLCAHYGQFLLFDDVGLKRELVERKVALFRDAAPSLVPQASPIAIPYRESLLPGYIRVPKGSGPFPCVVHIGGLDAAKEDALQFSDLCVRRGLAIVVYDGPGQGETHFLGARLDDGFIGSVSAVIDTLAEIEVVDPQRVGVVGRSTGGFLAAKASALDKRIKACVIWGAMYNLDVFDDIPPLVKSGFQFITGASSIEDTKHATRFIDLQNFASAIECPVLIVHGGRDNITPSHNAVRLYEELRGPKQLELYPDSIHCNHDVAHIVRPAMADWIAAQLIS